MEEKSIKKVKQKRLNFKKLLILILILYVISYTGYYLFKMPIKNIVITGTTNLSDYEIIETAKIKNYPSIFKTSSKTLEKRLKKLDLVKDVGIKKNLKGILTINITENKLLFVNKSTNLLILANGKEIKNANYMGVPTLINYVPSDLYEKLIEALGKVDNDIIYSISEIEYSQYLSSTNEVIDNERFLLRMNDDNMVYVNINNINKLNKYKQIVSSLENKGILYLDSKDKENFVFITYESLNNGN
jgi:cell division protein FtsQ